MQLYNFADTSLIVNGVHITGFGEGDDVITLKRNNNQSEHVMSADGDMIVFDTYDLSGTISFKLNPMSGSNGYMHALLGVSNVTGVRVPIMVQFVDLNGLDIVASTTGYLPKPPDMVRGLNSGVQTWSIIVERLIMLNTNTDYDI